LGALLIAEGKFDEGQSAWKEARVLAPSDKSLPRRMAEALAAAGRYRDALKELQGLEGLVAADAPTLIAVLRREADLARRLGDQPLASRFLVHAFLVAADTGQRTLQAELILELLRLAKGKPEELDTLLG